jgi:hypothetical protein
MVARGGGSKVRVLEVRACTMHIICWTGGVLLYIYYILQREFDKYAPAQSL